MALPSGFANAAAALPASDLPTFTRSVLTACAGSFAGLYDGYNYPSNAGVVSICNILEPSTATTPDWLLSLNVYIALQYISTVCLTACGVQPPPILTTR